MPLSVDPGDALDVKNLPALPSLRVIKVDAEDYTDWTGDPALRVTVLLDESTVIERVTGKDVIALKGAIHDNLLNHVITLFPYIFLVKPSELAETDED